jgi:hypothetical protein
VQETLFGLTSRSKRRRERGDPGGDGVLENSDSSESESDSDSGGGEGVLGSGVLGPSRLTFGAPGSSRLILGDSGSIVAVRWSLLNWFARERLEGCVVRWCW